MVEERRLLHSRKAYMQRSKPAAEYTYFLNKEFDSETTFPGKALYAAEQTCKADDKPRTVLNLNNAIQFAWLVRELARTAV